MSRHHHDARPFVAWCIAALKLAPAPQKPGMRVFGLRKVVQCSVQIGKVSAPHDILINALGIAAFPRASRRLASWPDWHRPRQGHDKTLRHAASAFAYIPLVKPPFQRLKPHRIMSHVQHRRPRLTHMIQLACEIVHSDRAYYQRCAPLFHMTAISRACDWRYGIARRGGVDFVSTFSSRLRAFA